MSEPAPALSINLEPNPVEATDAVLPVVPPAEAAGPATGAGADRSFIGHAKLVGALTLVSRVAGMAREIVAANFLGAQLVASAFTVAFTVPNLFRKLFGEGALSAAFIPLYAEAMKRESAEEANAFAAAGINLLCLLLLGITLVGELLLGALLLWGDRWFPDLTLTLRFTAIMLPYVLLICGGAFLSGILQVHRRFGAPAAAPILLNVVHIAVLVVGARMLHLTNHTPGAEAHALQRTLGYWLAFFVLVAGALQVAVLLPALRKTGFRFRPTGPLWTPKVRRMIKLTVPVALGAGVLQMSVLLDKGIAMGLMQREDQYGQKVTHFHVAGHAVRFPMEGGAPRRLDLAQNLYQFPLGIFAIALATAIFPALSAEALEKDRRRFTSVLRQGLEAALWEGLPASLGLILVAEPAVRLMFQRGHLTAHDADLIVRSVQVYAGAIWAFSLLQIVNRAYFAVHDTKTPFVMSVVNIVLNLAVEIPLLWTPLAESAMAVGTVVSFAVQAVVMLVMLDRRVGGLELTRLAGPALKMLLAAVVMAGACWLVQHSRFYPAGEGWKVWAMQLGLVTTVGAAVYFAGCAALGVGVLSHLMPRRRGAAANAG
jgi:putative peptidoglycan lipid II flippase